MVQLNLIGVILFLLKIFILLLLNLEKITSKSINYIAYLLKKNIYIFNLLLNISCPEKSI